MLTLRARNNFQSTNLMCCVCCIAYMIKQLHHMCTLTEQMNLYKIKLQNPHLKSWGLQFISIRG